MRLVRKTPLRAGLRSAILPGWGQQYAGQTGKGVVFMIAEAAALTGVVWTEIERQGAEDDYDDARAAYESADQIDEMEDAYAEMLRQFDELDKWHERRKLWSYAAAAVWLANVLDATLLFPTPGAGTFSAAQGEDSGFFASVAPERTEFGVAIRF